MTHRGPPGPRVLRDEARLLMLAGLGLLAIAAPATIALAILAMSGVGISATAPLFFGGPPVLLGYLACHFASSRLAQAKALACRSSASA